jgi:UDP-N-acetylmuramyl pentapeptide phosphotransferase/UDP-N-acetylglucosamine-1-phosphate transferase
MPALILSFITAFTITYLVMPVIIRVAKERALFDQPNERSAHLIPTPTLGGIGIFCGTFCALILWMQDSDFGALQYILVAFMLIFLVGARDDLIPMSPATKLMAQMLAAVVLVYKSQIRLDNLHGVFNLYELPELATFAISILIIVGIINAFNLIDGINGLAASIGLLAGVIWGVWFVLTGHQALAIIAFSISGSLAAFLKFNFTPAKIFMGDTGSQFIGIVCAILALKFIDLQAGMPNGSPYAFKSAPVIAFSILILPLFDTLWAFTRRVVIGNSPFSPDKYHIHHLLLAHGFNHMQATGILVLSTLLFLAIALAFDALGTPLLLAIQLCLAGGTALWLQRFVHRKAVTEE